ncbi:acyl-CoA dehydrogenase family protein [Kutzneria kofuensis]|uniref:Alkylation response protein AidB-like acyl-CoA dehydrogenase n=1 Tax=Kutzneria kofuensis TaxID=103725 RepID=A0A7W9KNH3_9PSEU|nr:acyl-CoA dehydrogenase family protein [Kutzneria kofuensis]MBB5895801.1 alkylation response protein AidB-like acyl-CoA dehydrogenase [Kutzneria kofuensis]
MRHTIAECERAGHDDGLSAGLALSGAGLDNAPGRVAAVPSVSVPAGATVLREEQGVSFVRTEPRSGPELTAIAARLAGVRLGLTRRLAGRVVEHLSGRTVGGEPTIGKQLVQGALADAHVAAEAARRTLAVADDCPDAVRDVHNRLTAADWELAKLLGASGFVDGGAMFGVHLSRLTANCWVGAA